MILFNSEKQCIKGGGGGGWWEGKRTNQKAGYKKKQPIDSIETKSSFYKKSHCIRLSTVVMIS
jgi:hypothetical protein